MSIRYDDLGEILDPAQFKGWAMDEDGTVFAYEQPPFISKVEWLSQGCYFESLNVLDITDKPDDWRESWRTMPKSKERWRRPGPDTAIDERVWMWCSESKTWAPRHWAGAGKVFDLGRTSWTSYVPPTKGKLPYHIIVLPNSDEPGREPPHPEEIEFVS